MIVHWEYVSTVGVPAPHALKNSLSETSIQGVATDNRLCLADSIVNKKTERDFLLDSVKQKWDNLA